MINIEEYLDTFFKGSKNTSLDSMKFFIEKYNNFEKNMKFIHIAGTNGKGSVTEMLTTILINSGYKVGKFLTPHLVKYNERISINNVEISNEEMENLIRELQPLINEYNKENEIGISIFELITIIGLIYFYKNNVDFVVLETGLGGITDATNIISNPLISIITSIGYDHAHILGKTLKEIAIKKAGIIKENSNTIIFNQTEEINNVFIEKCNKKNNRIHILSELDISNYYFNNNFQFFNYKKFKKVKLNLQGKIQIKNCCLCLEAIQILNEKGYKIKNESIKKGLETVVHHGRMEILCEYPKIIFDGAHNPPAIKCFIESVSENYSNEKRVYVLAILKRKDFDKMIEILAKDKNAIFILTSGNNSDKYATSMELYNSAKKYILEQKIKIMELQNSIEYIKCNHSKSISFFIGSLYTYGTVRKALK